MKLTFDECSPLVEHRPEDDTPISTAMVEAISAVADVPITDLPPLDDMIDPDALDHLFAAHQVPSCLMFQYIGYTVVVQPKRTIQVYDPQERAFD